MLNKLQKIKGVFIILAPFVIVAMMGMATLVVDVTVLRATRASLQKAVDASALAGTNAIVNGNAAAITAATNILNLNPIIGNLPPQNVTIQLGRWNVITKAFSATTITPNAVRVSADVTPTLYFAPFFSSSTFTLTKESTASMLATRDIMFIVDLTPLMNQYSQYTALNILTVGKPAIDANNLAIYTALGLPALGNMTYTPRLILGLPVTIKLSLALTGVTYPFPSGSFDEYISFVQLDPGLLLAGYSNRYGYLTFIAYLMARHPSFAETPGLWKTPQLPLESIKISINNFINTYATSYDRVGLVTFNNNSLNSAVLEQALSTNYSGIISILSGNPATNTPGRQPAHYTSNVLFNNVTPGLDKAVTELITNGRSNVDKVMFIFTGGPLVAARLLGITAAANTAHNADITFNWITVGPLSLDLVTNTILATINLIFGTDMQVYNYNGTGGDFSANMANMANTALMAHIVQ